jgi:hypothetical protein
VIKIITVNICEIDAILVALNVVKIYHPACHFEDHELIN